MKLYFKQRMFSWFDSYDIYHMDENGAVAFTVEGKLSWGHCLHILDPMGRAHRHGAAAGVHLPSQV